MCGNSGTTRQLRHCGRLRRLHLSNGKPTRSLLDDQEFGYRVVCESRPHTGCLSRWLVSAHQGAFRVSEGQLYGGREFDPGKDAHFWSSSTQPGSDSTGYLIRFGLVTYDAVTFVYDALKYGRSVRCLRDEPVSEAQSYSSGAKFFGYAARRPRVLE